MTTEELPAFGAVLKRYRVATGLTHEQLAERAGLSVRGISDLERGVRTEPRAYTVRQLAEALSLSADDRTIFEAAARAEIPVSPGENLPSSSIYLGSLPDGELVAREDEHQRLQSALDAVQGGSGQVILLGGELGSGKTRLLQEALSEGRARGYVVLAARCVESRHHTKLAPYFEALGSLAAAPPPGVRTEVQRSWKRITRVATALHNDANGSGPGVVEQQEMFSAVTEMLLLVARSVPVVFALDDLQWADELSLMLVVHLARATHHAPVLLLGAFRDVHVTEQHPALAAALQALSRERLAERLSIRRLSLDETTRLVGALMGDQPVSEEFGNFVYRRTKGVPRLIEGLIRSLGGRLELEEEIGAGAMGRVFRAYDRDRGEEVAAKLVLARSEIDLDALLRFQQEGAVLAKLHHPHIVDVYDTFAEEHASCIIMELLEGHSLGEILKGGPLPLARARAMALQVADALSYAYSQDIVHRDVKPDNVMVLPGDSVKVTDFGIARILQPDTSLATIATTGMRMGTPLYMAPEQIEGKKVDGRTDIYALGAMLYHMVTGRPPFEGSDALAVAVKHLQEEIHPPSQANPAIPMEWDALILKAMAKDPAKRFQSAEQMKTAIAALGEIGSSKAATARRPWPLAAFLGTIALAAIIFGGWWAYASAGQRHPGPISKVDAYLTQHHFSGYILLERHGHVLLSKGYGMADTKAHLPNTIRSKGPIPGTNRFMTAIAILRLQDQHQLSVHDTLCRYIAGCPGTWRPITIHQLLLDTSGLGTLDTSTAGEGVPQALALCKALPPFGRPGTVTGESSCNNLLLNIIVAKVSGKPWTAAMRDLLYGPAHMIDSGQLTNTVTAPQRVQGYSAGIPVPLGNFNDYYVAYSSVRDLERMDRALLSGHLLSRNALRALFTSSVSGDKVLSRYNGSNATQLAGCYECYLRKATRATVTVVDNPGTFRGFGADNALSPDDGNIAIMVKNDESGPDPTNVFFGLAAHLLWHRQGNARPPTSGSGTRIAAYLVRARFNGYVYLERHGQVILSKGFGMADAEDKLPNTLQTKWPAFAETRFLVGVAIMKLQEQGRLSIQDKICRYVRGCPASWRSITVRELLTNTSGMASFDPFLPGVTLSRTMAGCQASPLISTPGTFAAAWSDCNTFLLGVILERVTGNTWADAMQHLIFGPMGMTNSGRMTNALKPPQRGRLYRAGSPTPELNYDGYNLAYTTAEDMIRLNHALLAGKLISRRSLDTMFTPLFHESPGDPTAPKRGYEVVMWPDTRTTYRIACESCVNGGGEDDEGAHAGFFMTVSLSPEAGSLQVEINNDSAYFNWGENDNAFASFISKPLYGK